MDIVKKILMKCSAPPPPPVMRGRGIVTTGSDRYFKYLKRLAQTLFEAKNNLSVELIMREGEFSRASFKEMRMSKHFAGWRFIDMVKKYPQTREFTGCMLKPFAILSSSFRECLFLDADNSVLINPECVFEEPDYASTGLKLWPDHDKSKRLADKIHDFRLLLGLPTNFKIIESGQLLINKSKHWRSIWNAAILNSNSSLTYQYCYGDKDTFTISAELAKLPYAIGLIQPEIMRNGLTHFLANGTPAFHHIAGGPKKWPGVAG